MKKPSSKLLALLFAAFLLPMQAYAACNCEEEEEEEEDDSGIYRSYTYSGVKVGQHTVANDPFFVGTNQTATAFGAFLGTRYSEWFSGQWDFAYLGQTNSAKTVALALSGIHQFQIGNIGVFGKLGGAYSHTSVPASTLGGGRFGLTYGVGMTTELSGGYELQIGWDRYNAKFTGNPLDTFTYIGISSK